MLLFTRQFISALFFGFIFFVALNSGAELRPYNSSVFPFSMASEDDQFGFFLDNPSMAVNNIFQFETLALTKGRTEFEPWASSYWPIYLGTLANRYADLNIHVKFGFLI